MLNLSAEITEIKYNPYLCRNLKEYSINELVIAFSRSSSFLLKLDELNRFAASRWVSPKRTRSYPYARVYDTLNFGGKRITVIPIIKDEGGEGDRDFLQWDTISLMSLLNVNVILSYYSDAKIYLERKNKITSQKFDINHIYQEIQKLIKDKSDALHWNLKQLNNIDVLAQKALSAYNKLSNKLGIDFHSEKTAEKHIKELFESKQQFINKSRELAARAQIRETKTIQPKELVKGKKAALTIRNYLGGYYYFTLDEVEVENQEIKLIECKHSRDKKLPSIADIKDGLLKMILYTNLQNLVMNSQRYSLQPVLKLTSERNDSVNNLNKREKKILGLLINEAQSNGFIIYYNGVVV